MDQSSLGTLRAISATGRGGRLYLQRRGWHSQPRCCLALVVGEATHRGRLDELAKCLAVAPATQSDVRPCVIIYVYIHIVTYTHVITSSWETISRPPNAAVRLFWVRSSRMSSMCCECVGFGSFGRSPSCPSQL